MSRFRFRPEMFDVLAFNGAAAAQANAALDEHLKGLVKVYGIPLSNHCSTGFHEIKSKDDTHTALLWDLEELKPKECEHNALRQCGDGRMNCNDCGKVLEYRLVEV